MDKLLPVIEKVGQNPLNYCGNPDILSLKD